MLKMVQPRIRIVSLPTRKVPQKALLVPEFYWAAGGVLVVGIFVPCLLTWLHNHGALAFFHDDTFQPATLWNVGDWAQLQGCALLGCGPGALALTALLFAVTRNTKLLDAPSERGVMRKGALSGAVLSFANLPAYLCATFYDGSSAAILLRIAVLFAVTGATCGAWIAWQVYRESHPARGLFPRFSLRTLLTGAMAWGLLLTVYMPGF